MGRKSGRVRWRQLQRAVAARKARPSLQLFSMQMGHRIALAAAAVCASRGTDSTALDEAAPRKSAAEGCESGSGWARICFDDARASA